GGIADSSSQVVTKCLSRRGGSPGSGARDSRNARSPAVSTRGLVSRRTSVPCLSSIAAITSSSLSPRYRPLESVVLPLCPVASAGTRAEVLRGPDRKRLRPGGGNGGTQDSRSQILFL